MDDSERETLAVRAAEAGAAVAAERFRTAIDVETKEGMTDVVTQADRDAQAAVVEVIRDVTGDPIVGEEEGQPSVVPETGPAWVVDPIDGTNNYVRGLRTWCTSVAAVRDGEPVAGASVMPALDDAYVFGPDGPRRNGDPIAVSERTNPETFTLCPTIWWEQTRREEYAAVLRELVTRTDDIRRFGCAQGALAYVADGGIEAAVANVSTKPWDTLVGVGLVRAAGGTVTDVRGDRWVHDARGLVASNGTDHQTVLEVAQAGEEFR